MAIEYLMAVAVCIASAGFVGFMIWQRKEVPAAAFWSFAILASVPIVVLLIVPVIVDRLRNIQEVDTPIGKIFIAQQQVINSERQLNAAKEQARQSEQELKAAGKQVPPPPSPSGWQLEKVGFGDCPGRDISATAGAEPAPQQCTAATAGMSAVCWDGVLFVNRSNFGGDPWCTYKNIPPSQCVGGSSPGRLYSCVPSVPAK